MAKVLGMWMPYGVSWTDQGELAVLDSGTRRITIYRVDDAAALERSLTLPFDAYGLCAESGGGFVLNVSSEDGLLRRLGPEGQPEDDPFVRAPTFESPVLLDVYGSGYLRCGSEPGGGHFVSSMFGQVHEWSGEREGISWALPDFDPTEYSLFGNGFSPSDGEDGDSDMVMALAGGTRGLWISVSKVQSGEGYIGLFREGSLARRVATSGKLRAMGQWQGMVLFAQQEPEPVLIVAPEHVLPWLRAPA